MASIGQKTVLDHIISIAPARGLDHSVEGHVLTLSGFDIGDAYQFTKCPRHSNVGADIVKMINKTRDITTMMDDIDADTIADIWAAAFRQCEIWYTG